MSQENGSVKKICIGRKGLIEFRFGEHGTPFVVDVVATGQQWSEVDRQFRDDKNQVPREQLGVLNDSLWGFVRKIAAEHGVPGPEVSRITLAEALEFQKWIAQESKDMQDFFTVKSDTKEPSSPERSTTLTFSD